MKSNRVPVLLCTALLAVVAGCNRAGVIDATGGGGGSSASGNLATKAPPARIAHGERVNLKDYVVPGKTTIFDFTSEYCPPCRAIAPAMHKLHAEHADIIVVEVDLNRPGVKGIDWHSPVAEQYQMESIPHFKVYGPDGTVKAEGEDATQLVMGMLR